MMKHIRKQIIFQGTIQGVGFRPTVYRCAVSLGLTGFVQNRRSEVVTEIQGPESKIAEFLPHLRAVLPEAARIERTDEESVPLSDDTSFAIIESESGTYVFPPIPPDLAICDRCKRELFDPENRRYLYPFITCTQCGPRYSIVEDTPFDRKNTSMVAFPQCPDCYKEYTDLNDRRFHSQTNSCGECGPRLRLEAVSDRAPGPPLGAAPDQASGKKGASEPSQIALYFGSEPVKGAIEGLKQGKIVAVHGIGGFHLAVDPGHEEAMERLRRDKERERKPFALMVRDIEEAKRLVRLSPRQETLVSSPESPIVIVPVREDLPEYLRAVSDIGTLGIMLPYTPLHLLLFHHPETEIPYGHLVMTSGNVKGEPIITDPAAAKQKLAGTADLFLIHNRRIIFRTDDSVVRPHPSPEPVRPGGTAPPSGAGLSTDEVLSFTFLRRSRGYVPRLVRLPRPLAAETLAVGGDLKSSPAFGAGEAVSIAPYIGDLENEATNSAFEQQIDRILKLYEMKPKRLVYDMHPDYFSTKWVEERQTVGQRAAERISVQHHYAHILSVMAEHGLEEVLGLGFDGTGYGTDGTIWGGEFLHVGRKGFKRMGHITRFLLPGGDAAVLHPARAAYAVLSNHMSTGRACRLSGLNKEEAGLVPAMVARGLNSPVTSSLGRVFDAAASLLGLVGVVGFEGEGPMKLEGAAWKYHNKHHSIGEITEKESEEGFPFTEYKEEDDYWFTIDPAPILIRIAEESAATPPPVTPPEARPEHHPIAEKTVYLAALFHQSLAHAACRGAVAMRKKTGINDVALSGGVFQNMLLLRLLRRKLTDEGFSVYLNKSVSPGDGGIALGQLYYLALRDDTGR